MPYGHDVAITHNILFSLKPPVSHLFGLGKGTTLCDEMIVVNDLRPDEFRDDLQGDFGGQANPVSRTRRGRDSLRLRSQVTSSV